MAWRIRSPLACALPMGIFGCPERSTDLPARRSTPANTIAFCSTGCTASGSATAVTTARRVAARRRPQHYALCEHAAADRSTVELFIARRYEQRFAARLRAFMPRLFSLRDRDNAICGAFGLRAARQPLFVERYLDEPIERAIASRTGLDAARESIVEVGHLCGAFPGAMRTMIALLAPRLCEEGFAWVAFAGTTGLCNAFRRVGMLPIQVRAAASDRLSEPERRDWGRYYDHSPRVLIGRIEDGIRALAAASGAAAMPSRRSA